MDSPTPLPHIAGSSLPSASSSFSMMTATPTRIDFKLTRKDGPTRRISFPHRPTWAALASKIAQLYDIPLDTLALAYRDSDDDDITLNSDDELKQHYADSPEAHLFKFDVRALTGSSAKAAEAAPTVETEPSSADESNPELDWARRQLAREGVEGEAGDKVLGAFAGLMSAMSRQGPPHHRGPPHHFGPPPHHRFGPFRRHWHHGPPPFGRHFDHYGPPPHHRGPPPPFFHHGPPPPPPHDDPYHSYGHPSSGEHRRGRSSRSASPGPSSERPERATPPPESAPPSPEAASAEATGSPASNRSAPAEGRPSHGHGHSYESSPRSHHPPPPSGSPPPPPPPYPHPGPGWGHGPPPPPPPPFHHHGPPGPHPPFWYHGGYGF